MSVNRCPICNSSNNCEHSLIKFVNEWEPDVYNEDAFIEELHKWSTSDKSELFESPEVWVINPIPNKLGSSVLLPSGEKDTLFSLLECLGRSDILTEVLFEILTAFDKDALKSTVCYYLKNTAGATSPIGENFKILKNSNDDLIIELIFWANHWQEVAIEVDRYLRIFMSLTTEMSVLSKMLLSELCHKLNQGLREENTLELKIDKNICVALLQTLGLGPPDDSHRRPKHCGIRITEYFKKFIKFHDYEAYKDGFYAFLRLKEKDRKLHSKISKFCEYILTESLGNQIPPVIGEELCWLLDRIRVFFLQKHGLGIENIMNMEKKVWYQHLNTLGQQNKIGPIFKPAYSYLNTLANSLKHTGENIGEEVDVDTTMYILKSAINHLFLHVLPELH